MCLELKTNISTFTLNKTYKKESNTSPSVADHCTFFPCELPLLKIHAPVKTCISHGLTIARTLRSATNVRWHEEVMDIMA